MHFCPAACRTRASKRRSHCVARAVVVRRTYGVQGRRAELVSRRKHLGEKIRTVVQASFSIVAAVAVILTASASNAREPKRTVQIQCANQPSLGAATTTRVRKICACARANRDVNNSAAQISNNQSRTRLCSSTRRWWRHERAELTRVHAIATAQPRYNRVSPILVVTQ